LGRKPVDPVNTSLTWARADESMTTLVWLHNYWSDAYGIAAPHLHASLVDLAGATVATFEIDLDPDATEAIDVRARCRELGVPLPHEGELLLALRDDAIVPGGPVQVFGEYVRTTASRAVCTASTASS